MLRAAPAPLSKVTMPAPAAGLLHRSRLYRLLADSPAGMWIGSPAASGKTVLASACLRAAGTPAVWMQIDSGDADPGSFFHFLALAALPLQTARQRAPALPRWGKEAGDALGEFARAWFRVFFSRLPAGTTLVFDDWHRLPAHNPLQQVLAGLLDELPPGMRLWVLSREAAPAALDVQRLRGRLHSLAYADLALTADEARALVAGPQPEAAADDAVAAQWLRWCDGWVGALVFALAAGRREPGALPATLAPDATDTVFGGLAAEVFDHADAPLRRFMLATAWSPHFTADLAQRLCSSAPAAPAPRAAACIADLQRRNLLIAVPTGRHPSWRYHRLLREFLQRRAQADWPADSLAAHLAHSAACLEDAGLPEQAAGLLVQAQHWPALVQLLLRHAPALLRDGRYLTLAGWAQALPDAQRTPWVDHWWAAALLPQDPRRGLQRHAIAFDGFWAAGDADGLYRSWCGVVEGITYACDDYGALDHWLQRLRLLRERFPRYPSPLVAAQVTVYGFSASFFLEPNAPEFPRWLRNVQRLYRFALRRSDRAAIGGLLGLYHTASSGMAVLGAHLQGLRPLLDDPAVPAFHRLVGGLPDVVQHWIGGSTDDALQRLDVYHRLAQDSGAHAIDRQFAFQRVYVHCLRGELAEADAQLQHIAGALAQLGQIDVAQFHFLAGWRAALAGRAAEAVQLLEQAVDITRSRRFLFLECCCRGLLGELLAAAGDLAQAEAHTGSALALARRMGSVTAEAACGFQHAAVAVVAADLVADLPADAATAHPGQPDPQLAASLAAELPARLAQALAFAQRHGHWAWGGLYPPTLARLCASAIAQGIHTEQARSLVRRRGLPAPAGAQRLPHWPWPLQLRCLGGLVLVRDGEPLVVDGKAQRRPLELLHALLAAGGQNVATSLLTDQLWPDAEGDAAQRALITTLQRLRELLGQRSALLHGGGRLSLNPAQVWVDLWAFDAALDAHQPEAALALYRGDFLAGEAAAWLQAQRARCQRRLLAGLLDSAEAAHRQAGWARAERLLEAAVVVDALAEPAWQQLVALHLAQQQTNQARRACQRCQQQLAQGLGAPLSPRTLALCQPLLGDAAGPPAGRAAASSR